MTVNSTGDSARRTALVYLAMLSVGIFVAWSVLLRYFFAQDDFILIAQSTFFGREAFLEHFQSIPGQFRPLTKVVYFAFAHEVFGMNATAYRVVATVLHVGNTLLVYVFLRRCRSGVHGALVGATLFGLSTGFFHVLAWISCVQQLLGNLFTLAAMIMGIDAGERRDPRRKWISLGLYLLALMSYESAAAVPVLLMLHAWLVSKRDSGNVRRMLSTTLEHWLLLGLYLGMMLIWKRIPEDGVYSYHVGTNVLRNLANYLGWSAQYQVMLPFDMNAKAPTLMIAHVFIAALTVYHLARRRWQPVTFAYAYFLATIAPALFLVKHTYYLHTYVPAVGLLLLVAPAVDDVMTAPRLKSVDAQRSVLTVFLLVMIALSYHMVRRNERAVLSGAANYRSSFVIRRAIAAENVWKTVAPLRSPGARGVMMVYGRVRDMKRAAWQNRNVIEATGKGAALRLLYGSVDLEVDFLPLEELSGRDAEGTDVFLYDDFGNCRRPPVAR